jgi:hypothetical protein
MASTLPWPESSSLRQDSIACCSLWTEALGEWGGVGDVAELDGNQLALTLDGAAGPQNLGRQDLNDDRSRSRRRMKP